MINEILTPSTVSRPAARRHGHTEVLDLPLCGRSDFERAG
jgi:hypothetical protein